MSSRTSRVVLALLAAAILAVPIALTVVAGPSGSPSVRIAAGGLHSCAITGGGRVRCWGANGHTELGTGAAVQGSATPVDVAGLPAGITAISAGHSFYTCALTAAGGVKCWGGDQLGQLGNDSTPYGSGPVDVVGLTSGVTAVAAGSDHACAVTVAGGVKCWGSGTYITFANNQWQNNPTPADVPALTSGVVALAAGASFTCALTTGGGVKCWGDNHDGELGNGDNPPTNLSTGTPVDVVGLTSGVAAIAAYFTHACALTSAGGIRCWGQNHFGELGNGSTGFSRTPVDVTGLTSGVTAIATGYHETCAVTSAGGVKCWGSNLYGGLGNGNASMAQSTTPVDVSGLSGVVGISVGQSHACALLSSGGIKCWGEDDNGQLGNGAPGCAGFNRCLTPVSVVGIPVRRTIALHPSRPAGSISHGTAVTFTATVKPLEPAGSHATVRFEVYHQVSGVWKLALGRNVTASSAGLAKLAWTFSTTGSWYVRAEALANSNFGASAWSPHLSYTVH